MTGQTEQRLSRGAEATTTPVVPPQAGPVDPATVVSRPEALPERTGPGSVLVERYRLQNLVGVDTIAAAEFWQAVDTVLQRDVAITVLREAVPRAGAFDPDHEQRNAEATERAASMIARALRSGYFEHPGCARLLDVLGPGSPGLPSDVLGAAVTEWIPGRSLGEVVSHGLLRPRAAARAVLSLAAAAADAHRHGLVLGCDHPQRLRVSADGRVQLCFALPRPDVSQADDVRGVGAVLYALLTSSWPLSASDATRAGLATAERSPDGELLPPSAQRPGVPVEFDALTTGTIGPVDAAGRVRTAAAVHRLIEEVLADDEEIVLFPHVPDGLPPDPGDVWQDPGIVTTTDPERRRKMFKVGGGLAVGVLIVIGFLAVQLASVFGEPSVPPSIIVHDQGAEPAAESPAAPPGGAASGRGAVTATRVEVYDHVGDPDNSARVALAVDGNTGTGWRTFTYRQQFPALKPGVGVMASFASPVQLSELTITSPSPGTRVEIRSAPTADATFGDTVLITEATLGDGPTTVSLADSQPVEHILVWITRLAGGPESGYSSEISEITFRPAGI